MGASAQIRREQKFQSGQIPENAEEQQYRHAAPEQDVFRPATFGKPSWIPQRPYQNAGEPERSEQGGGKVFGICKEFKTVTEGEDSLQNVRIFAFKGENVGN